LTPLYDTIGRGYSRLRRPDPRIRDAVVRGLGPAASVLNVGAGAGSYEPIDRRVVAVEPSLMMIRQRPPGAAPVVRATAGSLPFRDGSFDATLAVLTIHHWPDKPRGLAELRRTARDRIVILTWDPSDTGFWLSDYFPEILDVDRRIFPPIDRYGDKIGTVTVSTVPIPHDCSDGFLGAYWRRPAAYLDPEVRLAISTFSRIREVERGLEALRRDLESGYWDRRYGAVLTQDTADLGYRLLVSR